MGKWGIFYSSVTNNMKKIAEAMAEATEQAELKPVEDMPEDLTEYEVVALGYWLKRGGPDPKMMSYLPKVKNSIVNKYNKTVLEH